MALETHHR